MPLHLIKLCVGAESIEDLAAWQKERLAEKRKKGLAPEIHHVTRMTPKRIDELEGGSLYWVIKGQIAVRQKLLAFKSATKKGVPHCALVLDAKLVPVARRKHRAFQGWRYFEAKDAPADLKSKDLAKLPEALQAELADLGLL